jgi:ubiquinone/menaquinone biosynthesis C-methylase UbiE
MTKHWPTATDGMIMTKNKTGYMFTTLCGASPLFLEAAATCHGTLMDLACAYGVTTLKALNVSDAKVIAIDLSQEHLSVLKKSLNDNEKKRTVLLQMSFPKDFNIESSSIDLLHCSFMMLFLSEKDIIKGLSEMFRVLKPGGRIFINMVSPYAKAFSTVLSTYESKKNAVKNPQGLLKT